MLRSRSSLLLAVLLGLAARTTRADVNLVATGVVAPSTAGDCASLDVLGPAEVTFQNRGSDPALATLEILVFEDVDLDGRFSAAVDQDLGRAIVMPPVAPGASLLVPVTISGRLQFRDNRLHAWVDSGGAETESDEGDNVAHSGDGCLRPPPVPSFDLVVEWLWDETPVITAPIVGDVNADGTPDVVFPMQQGEMVVLDGRTGREIWRSDNPLVQPAGASTPALGDIDGDPGLEIVSVANGNNLAAWDDDGQLLWLSPELTAPHPLTTGAVTLADIDCDGSPEAIYGPDVVRTTDGSLYWNVAAGGTTGSSLSYAGITSVADVDGDGTLEVIAGPTAYILDPILGLGTGLWRNYMLEDGFTAIGQFDADPLPEIVVVSPGRVALLEGESGDIIWDVPLPLGGRCVPAWSRGGPPTIGDVDGDGEPEIGIADSDQYVVLETDGSVKWTAPTQDCSSAATGSTVFDFDGDGTAEVVYQDEYNLHVFRGTDGFELASHRTSSGTVQEMPTIADVDGDNRAEIITALTPWPGSVEQGIRVFGDRNDNWVNARRIWNQHAYHVDNVTDDGKIPPNGTGGCKPESWLTQGTYRLQQATGGAPLLGLPDVTLTMLDSRVQSSPACETEVVINVRVGNGGAIRVGRALTAGLHDADPAMGGRLVASMPVPDLRPGEWWDVTLTAPVLMAGTFHVIADDDGTGLGAGSVTECREDNNACTAAVGMPPPPGPPAAVGDALRATAHGDPHAADISGTFEWLLDAGLPRPAGDHYHLVRATRADLLAPIPGTEPWTQLTWTDVTPASAMLPACHFLRVLAASACDIEQELP